jgi:NMD protein affecting ribosome stability and mRNA decay
MLRDGKILCDTCGQEISRATVELEGGGARMHNICSACFVKLKLLSIPPA